MDPIMIGLGIWWLLKGHQTDTTVSETVSGATVASNGAILAGDVNEHDPEYHPAWRLYT